MSDQKPIHATCSCGDIAITLARPPVFQAVCACRDCQSRTGSAFGASAYFDSADIVERRGDPVTYRRVSQKGRWLDFRFCPRCGVTVWWEAEFLPGKVGVAGQLLENHEFRPDGAYFCATKPDWVHFDPSIPVGQGATTGG